MAGGFSHLDPGTPEDEWAEAFRTAAVARADLDVAALVVVAAHPDDETLGAGGLIGLVARRGTPVRVIVATDGEGSHPASPTRSPAELARTRRDEVTAALELLCPGSAPEFLGIPDGAVAAHARVLAGAVSDVLDTLPQPALVIAPWSGDGHGDHRAAAEATAEVCRRRGAAFRGYPIWLWHWGTPADAPWEHMERVPLDGEAQELKARAMAEHRSQTSPLSPAVGDEAVLHSGMRAHFSRPFEILVLDAAAPSSPLMESAATTVAPTQEEPSPGSTPRQWFDDFYDRNGDPWGFDTRWYEQRKRAVLLGALPRRGYEHALELGCSTGALTAALADRCERVTAVDFAQAALDAARERIGDRESVELRQAALPAEWPDGAFDLIVLSELGYYWDAADLERAIDRMLRSLRPGGHIVACHWRHPVASHPVTGDGVHVALRTQPDLHTIVHHEEEDFLLDVFGTAPARSVAAETGLLP